MAEQIEYYRARASEYDEWFLRVGQYDHGPELNQRWCNEVAEVREALDAFRPAGKVLEFAAGTGLWTTHLARYVTEITVVDSSPEVLALNQARVDRDVSYVQADIFNWSPDARYDVVFFSFWLSHVPADLFERFWKLVDSCLMPNGRVFCIDSLDAGYTSAGRSPGPHSNSRVEGREPEIATRRLNDGRVFDIFKIYYQPAELSERLKRLGWRAELRSTAHYFLYGSVQRADTSV